MPLVRVSIRTGAPPGRRRTIGDAIHAALVETIGIPAGDRFQVITEHDADGLIADPTYLDIERSEDTIFVQIALRAGRAVEAKQRLYARIAERLHDAAGYRPQDVLITLVENSHADWSFGNGIAQYVPAAEPPA